MATTREEVLLLTDSLVNEASYLRAARPAEWLAGWPSRDKINPKRLEPLDESRHLVLVGHVHIEGKPAEVGLVRL